MSKTENIDRVVLAYSGGLDTSVIVHWLRENYDCEVIAFSADLGQKEDLEPLRERAREAGAEDIVIRDLREEFANDYVLKGLKAQAVYENGYPLATALGRPLISKHMIDVAREYDADAIAHGSTGKGNDQVRFEVSAKALDSEIEVLAPVRDWELDTRDDEIEYAQQHGIPIEASKESPYSYDLNLWGVSIECGPLEDPWTAPPEDIYLMTQSPEDAPGDPEEITVGFEAGKPVELNGDSLAMHDLIERLNKLAGQHGIGRIDMVENRLVGLKSREVYEAPAGVTLMNAHRALMDLVLERDLYHHLEETSHRYAKLVYNGQWFSPLRQALDAMLEEAQDQLTGTVRMKLYKGNAVVNGRKSPESLYDEALATYDEGDVFDQSLSKGFNELWGLPLKVAGRQRSLE
ncbi:MAG: argininosuccinate synthase [bacterium]